MKKKVCITNQIPEIGIRLLKEKYHVEICQKGAVDETFLSQIRNCDAIVSLLSDKIDENIFSVAPKLKIVANYAVGYNNIDLNAAKKYKIMVTNTPGVLTHATAEIAFALMISLTRRIIEADKLTRAGHFTGWEPMLLLGDELNGKTMGIVGMGRIGQSMAIKCRAFGMNIIYHNRTPLDENTEKALEAAYCSFDELLQQSDVISLHTPSTRETFHLINEAAFKKMKTGVYLINTSRGEVIDEAALVSALRSGKVKGAGLDVYEFEPEITHELFSMENVILLPHIGSATTEARNKMSEMVARNVIAALEGKNPENLVPELEADG
ncbi:2-hydroxyacid dehydrogenase [Desulfonema magnum]|uniref:Glyoxylate reductase n=1 Tax=Desulfonema magnum TaxID=45655 RepID=A0A975BWN2_9BACT|nr:D-glycerate dehydrogenase [Desulfonema magnum]QTA93096.1 Glyoxylate reductase [Desulfonema magnum]